MSTVLASAFRNVYDVAFQVSPIILNGGIVSGTLGNMMPIIGLTGQLLGTLQGALSNGGLSMDDFPIRYMPIPGGTLINNAIGTYPFANQQVAANAVIQQPLNISLLMIAPVNQTAGYLTKLALLTSLQNSLQAHNNAGGTYMIATPAFVYTNCVMTAMTDVTSGDTKQQQIQWQLDFVKPLITQESANAAYSGLMNKLAGGSQVTNPTWSGQVPAVGSPVQGAVQNINGMSGSVSVFTGSQQ